MKRLSVFSFLIVLFFTVNIVKAQDEMGGIPYSFSTKKISMNIPQMKLPSVDHAALLEEDAAQEKNNPLRISVHQVLNYTMKNSGRVDILDDGSKLWRVNIKSPNAYATYLHFSSFDIPEGASLFAYSPDQQFIRGKYTKKNEGGDFYVLDIPGDEIVVEYYEPAGATFAGHFEIAGLGHLYRDVFVSKGRWGYASDCHINVACPEAQVWLNQINSVVCVRAVIQGGSYLCSGVMMNNTRLDRKPYVYTAAHCYKNGTTWNFYFGYHAPTCNNNVVNNASSFIGYHASGGIVRAVDHEGAGDPGGMSRGPDFMLLEITGTLSKQILDHLYFAGWDISSSIPSVGAAIHHPSGDFKKYSKPLQNSLFSDYYWKVDWLRRGENKGVTEIGSSGSPLFNAEGYTVGHLSRGISYCESQQVGGSTRSDYYGKISAAWIFKENPTLQLKHWLDPDNTGVTKLSGGYYSQIVSVENNKEKIGFAVNIYPNPTIGTVKINGNFNGERIQCNIYSTLGTLVHKESIVVSNEFELNLELTNGVYFLELQGKERKSTHKLIISK